MTITGEPVLITASTVIVDADRAPLRPGGVVVVDGKIVASGTVGDLEREWSGVQRRVDLGTMTIVPGMIDAHVHLCLGEGDEEKEWLRQGDDDRIVEGMTRHARELAEAGVTTARDLGSPRQLGVRVRDALERTLGVGPRLLVANAPLTSPGGHAWQLGGTCEDVQALRRRVRERHQEGADLVKVMVTGGGTTPGSDPARPQFGRDEIEAVVEEAAALGMPVAAHAHGTAGIRSALEAGVSTIEHCTWMGEGKAIGAAWDPRLVAELARRGTPVCPTASALWDGMAAPRRQAKVETVRRMHSAGVNLIAGTDAGVTNVLHGNYVRGLEALQECGLSPGAVLAAATKGAAEALGVGQLVGTLEPGKAADLVAVHGNPLEDVSALRGVQWVMCDGRVIRSADSPQAGPQ